MGHGLEVIARPMAKTKGDRVGDALCFHLASFERVACKARASDLLGVTPVGPRPHPLLSSLRLASREKVRDDTIVNAQRRDIIGYVTKE